MRSPKNSITLERAKERFHEYYDNKYSNPLSRKRAKMFDAMYQKKESNTLKPDTSGSSKYLLPHGPKTFDMMGVDWFPEGDINNINDNIKVRSRGSTTVRNIDTAGQSVYGPRVNKNDMLYSEYFRQKYNERKDLQGKHLVDYHLNKNKELEDGDEPADEPEDEDGEESVEEESGEDDEGEEEESVEEGDEEDSGEEESVEEEEDSEEEGGEEESVEEESDEEVGRILDIPGFLSSDESSDDESSGQVDDEESDEEVLESEEGILENRQINLKGGGYIPDYEYDRINNMGNLYLSMMNKSKENLEDSIGMTSI